MVVVDVDGILVVALVEGDVALAGVVVEGRVGGSVARAAAEDVAVQPLHRVSEGEEWPTFCTPPARAWAG